MPLFGRQFVVNRPAAVRRWKKKHVGFGWPKFDWRQADWSQADAEIAERFGLHRNSVNKIRKRQGLKQPSRTTKIVNGQSANWTAELDRRSKWDWARTNRELAYEYGACVASVARTRQRLRKLGFKVDNQFQCAYSHTTCPIRTRQWTRINWDRPNNDIAARLGCSERTVRRARKRFKK